MKWRGSDVIEEVEILEYFTALMKPDKDIMEILNIEAKRTQCSGKSGKSGKSFEKKLKSSLINSHKNFNLAVLKNSPISTK